MGGRRRSILWGDGPFGSKAWSSVRAPKDQRGDETGILMSDAAGVTMPDEAILVFTGRSVDRMIAEGGSSAWALNPARARTCKYIVCARNSHAKFTTPGPEPHRSVFLVARLAHVTPAAGPSEEGRYLLAFRDYALVQKLDVWRGRNPVRYTTLERLGMNAATLDWNEMPATDAQPAVEASAALSGSVPLASAIAEAEEGLVKALGATGGGDAPSSEG